MNLLRYLLPAMMLAMLGCSGGNRAAATEDAEAAGADAPKSSPDTLYQFVADQVSFGPRVPGSEAHKACGDYIVAKLRSYGADTIIQQHTSAKIFTGETRPIRNIFARYNPDAKNRLLLLAHYDTRPMADEDPDPSNRNLPIDGANDGASGVAVLLEMARQLSLAAAEDSATGRKSSEAGIDLLFVDLEDSGSSGDDDSWCLGTQAFAASLPQFYSEYPRYGILVDMVGGQGAVFPKEYLSTRYTKEATDRVWSAAYSAGMSDRFPNRIGGSIIDDHVYINRAGIPCVDIIESANPSTGSFPPTWHTMADNLSAIDRSTLASVADLLLILINN